MSKWTEEQVKLLIDLWQSGYTARQISDKLGVFTRNAVIGKANRLGLSAPAKTNTRREERVVDASFMRASSCQWPEGTPGMSQFRYCGKPVEQGYPYCSDHKQEAYRRKVGSAVVA